MSARRRQHVLSVAAALGGLALFAWAVRRAGIPETIDGSRRVGWGLIPILSLGGLRLLIRSEAWRLCAPSARRLKRVQAFTAFLAGDAIGNVTPFGLLASEPTKVFLTRQHLATRDSISSLAIDNLLYSSSIVIVISIAGAVVLATLPLPFEWREAVTMALALLLVATIVVVRMVRGEPGRAGVLPPAWRSRVAGLAQSVSDFTAGHPLRLWRVLALDFLFHALAVLEAYLALKWLLGTASPTLREAFLFEALNRVVTVVFKFVPFRVGVDEASSGALAPLLAMDPALGVSLAVVRKVRNLFWAAIGLAVIAVLHVRAAPATDHHGSAPVRRT